MGQIEPMEKKSKKFLTSYTQNRELSWLKFNKRVLEEAEDSSVPLCERLKFVEIFTSNLDEFFMVRVGSLLSLEAMDAKKVDNKSLMTAREQLNAIFDTVRELYGQRDRVFAYLRRKLLEKGIGHANIHELSKKQYACLEDMFQERILPVLSPQIIDKHHPFPHLDNKKLYISAVLKGKKKLSYEFFDDNNLENREYGERYETEWDGSMSRKIRFIDSKGHKTPIYGF